MHTGLFLLKVFFTYSDLDPTLLVKGPFFGVRYYLSSYQGNVALARKLQELLDEKAISL